MRRMAAAYMRSHADEFAPFLTDADGEPLEGGAAGFASLAPCYSPALSARTLPDEAFRKYLVDLETTAMWGGQPEVRRCRVARRAAVCSPAWARQITALSHSLRRPVHVWMASAPKLVIGAQYEKDSGPVQLRCAAVARAHPLARSPVALQLSSPRLRPRRALQQRRSGISPRDMAIFAVIRIFVFFWQRTNTPRA